MKKTILSLAVLFTLFTTSLMAQESPKNEFNVRLTSNEITLLPGSTQDIEVTINRSKGYRKAKVKLFIDNELPKGITVSYTDGENPLTQQVMTISADESISSFSKTIILKGKSRGITKGAMFKLNSNTNSITKN